MPLETRTYDSARYLDDEEAIEAYLADAFEEGEPRAIAHALGVIARARGMTKLARDTGIARESLYRALSGEGNPEFATIMKVMAALGLRITARAERTQTVEKRPRRARAKSHRDAA
jgi:probable addiction module antidote protein